MPQMISRNTVLLQGAGRTNIEYSAGPNINITNDVISGKDWSNEIAEAAGSSVSSHLSGGDHISIETNDGISTISVTGDFYSAGDNINITNNVISGKDWTNDIDSHIESAISGKADASAIPEIVDYSAGANIDITDHVISGKDWSYEIGQKADRSEVIERISAASESIVNNLTETISSTSSELYDIISATSGQGGGSCPWISGGKDYGSATVQLNFGDTIPVFSSWGLSADHNHYIWMKGAYVRLPDGSEFLPNSAFSGYTASMASNMENNWNYTNSAYSMAINNTHNKLDNSAFSAYTAAHSADDVIPYSGANGIDVTDHVISFTGEAGSNYSAGANIDITDNVISGKDWTGEISAASSILNQMIASGDNVAYSAGNNIDITNHVISGKDWTNEIASSTSGKLDSSWTAGKDVTPYSAGSNINVTNHVISGKDWTETIDEHIESAISGIEIPSAKPVSGTSGIKIEETENSVVFSISGDVGKTYSAGSNIYISNQNVISGRDWTTNINSATSGKLDSTWTAGKDVTPYSAGDNIDVTNHVISGKNWSNDITAAISSWSAEQTFGKVYSGISPINVDNVNDQISLDPPEWTLCAGPNIHISADSLTENLYVSGKDWTNDISSNVQSAISAWSAGQTFGSDYTSPSGTVIVDNDNATVEASTSGLITSSYFAPSATDFGPINISMNQMYGLNKVVDNFISGQVLSSFNHWNITPGGEQDMIMLVMDNDSVVAYSGRPSPPDAYENPWSIPYTANGSGYNLYLSGSSRWSNGESPIKGKSYTAVEVTGYGVVDLYNNYSAGPGISIENHVISAGAGNKVSYFYNTPVTSISSDGDLLISRQVASTTPDKIKVQVGSSDVGLLVPTNTGHNSMLVTNAMGSVQWADQSAVLPSAVEQTHKVRVYSNDSTYSGENALNDYPALDHDWEFTIINQYDNSAHWLYYSALGGTATLNPGRGVRVYYCQNTNTLYSEPEFVTDFGDDYATQWGDLGGLKLREVGTSAEASGNGILYVITGGN